ncbi:sugar transferase [Limnoglobus roseus]|uniref:sugar transferase n=1 Tax=Limnoglobus roseus TaxID=2598579 RepID=UPI0028F41C2A|nr:sugar transferase [Limnoglobus roseus]
MFHVKAIALETVALPTPLRRPMLVRDLFHGAVAAALFVLALPVMILAMLVVKMTSRGPAIYQQTRSGRGGVPFTIYKIRTMRSDAEKDGRPQWSTRGDSRITLVGRFLRATHIDELPQLWNVLSGEMSLVGPRPERPEIIAVLRQEIAGYDRRLAVKPGITGFAQIHLPPDETTNCVRRKLTYDLFYIHRAGIVFDFGILVCTALKVVGLKAVYRRK